MFAFGAPTSTRLSITDLTPDDHQPLPIFDADTMRQLEHEQAIDCGDDSVNADQAMAEIELAELFPEATGIIITRKQCRIWSPARGGRFETVWSAFVAGPNLRGEGATLAEAVAELRTAAPQSSRAA